MSCIDKTKGKFPIIVYGILKDRFEGESIVIGADCYDLGDYPAITKLGTNNQLQAKLIYIDADTLKEFDRIEGVPFLYTREVIQYRDVTAFIYVYVNGIKNKPLITNWIRKEVEPLLVDDNVKLLISDTAGIYIPRNFYEHYDLPTWGLKISDYRDLSHPDNEGYWESWDDLLKEAKHTDDKGVTWLLDQNGDLFAITEAFMQLDDNDWFDRN